MRAGFIPLLILLSTGVGGCMFGRKAQVVIPVKQAKLPPPLPSQEAKRERILLLDVPPEVEPSPLEATIPLPDNAPLPPNRRPAAPRPPKPPGPRPPTPPSGVQDSPTPSVPRLSEFMTDEQRRQVENELNEHLNRARSVLNQASARGNLSQNQAETVSRIETFVQQADQARNRDLDTARELARRADILGQDLLLTFR
jgi:hypothetical protein